MANDLRGDVESSGCSAPGDESAHDRTERARSARDWARPGLVCGVDRRGARHRLARVRERLSAAPLLPVRGLPPSLPPCPKPLGSTTIHPGSIREPAWSVRCTCAIGVSGLALPAGSLTLCCLRSSGNGSPPMRPAAATGDWPESPGSRRPETRVSYCRRCPTRCFGSITPTSTASVSTTPGRG